MNGATPKSSPSIPVASDTDLVNTTPGEVGLSEAALHRLAAMVEDYVRDGKIAGAITAIVRRGKVPYAHMCGYMDLEQQSPMRPDTLFRLYSMTKPLASVALMTLYERGAFQLDQPVSDFIPSLGEVQVFVGGSADDWEGRPPQRAISVRDVLCHTSGFSSGGRSVPGEIFNAKGLAQLRADGRLKETWTLADMMEALATVPLEFEPGSRWRYGVSPDVAARLCEVITGRPFDEFLASEVLEPLGMTSTSYQVTPEDLPRLSSSYRRGRAGEPPLVALDTAADSRMATRKTYFSGSGGLVATAGDYVRFAAFLTGHTDTPKGRVLGHRTTQFMMSNHLPGGTDLAAIASGRMGETVMTGVGFGLGFAVLLDPALAQTIGTPGEAAWGGAASTAFFVSPADDLGVVFMTQLQPSNRYDFRRELRAAVYAALED